MKDTIRYFATSKDKCGLEVYIVTKGAPRLKRMNLYEGDPGGTSLYSSMKDTVINILLEKYLSVDAEYVSADQIADNQNKFYIIEQNDEYKPFDFISTETGVFSKSDIKDATAILFKLQREEKVLWAYQHLWSMMIPNKTSKGIIGQIMHIDKKGDVFTSLKDPVLTIAKKIDFLIIDSKIIASDHRILQQYFGFQDYIRIRANKTISLVAEKDFVESVEKMIEYCNRGNGKPRYAKKMMRIADSKVLKMPVDKMMENIHNSKRWNGMIPEENGKFSLKTYADVELLIDLLDERYTRSDITKEEYDTDVKKVAKPIEQTNGGNS